jgi:predicted ATP-dependent serine protease
MASKRVKKPAELARSLASVQVDVTSRLGAVAPATTTGMPDLDTLLGGGLRNGTHLLISGAPGVGKTAFALMLAYMAARARAAVLYTSVGLDDTEIVARLAARAVHREYQNVNATYGTIWFGESMQDPALRGPISNAINTVVKKVGDLLHLHQAEPMEDISITAELATELWARNDRVVVVVDGIEAYSAGSGGAVNGAQASGYDAGVAQVAYELSRLAVQGCAVVSTCHSAAFPLVAPAATVAAELRPVRASSRSMKKKVALDTKAIDLVFLKNRYGPSATLPLLYAAAASIFQERQP